MTPDAPPAAEGPQSRAELKKFAWLSIAAAVTTIAMKMVAWWLTSSVGLLSDALESLVNLVAAVTALLMLSVAARPPDEDHPFGHGKAEYFASGFEGAMIFLAAILIGWTAIDRLLHLKALEQVGLGLAVSTGASVVNLLAGRLLIAAGKKHHSITLEADGHHLMTDVWTSAGVLVGLGLVKVTGWNWLDPVVALLVAANIVRMGVELVRRSALGLLDTALPEADQKVVQEVLARHGSADVSFHAVRTRQAAARRFVYMHVLVPGEWTVHDGHQKLEAIEHDIRAALPGVTVFTHLEALSDPSSFDDQELDRVHPPRPSAAPRA